MDTNTRIKKSKNTNSYEYTNSSIRDNSSEMLAKICQLVPIRLSACGGLTLTELLITMGIIVLLLAAGVPAYRHYNNVNNLAQASQDVKNAILETKSYALAPPEDKSADADSYMIFLRYNSDYYSINSSSSQSLGSTGQEIKSYRLPSGIVSVNPAIIQYSIADQGKIIYGLHGYPPVNTGNEINITLKSDKLTSNNTKTLKVNRETGQISIQ